MFSRVMSLLPSPLTPLAKKGLEDLLPLYEGPPEPDSPHSFQVHFLSSFVDYDFNDNFMGCCGSVLVSVPFVRIPL